MTIKREKITLTVDYLKSIMIPDDDIGGFIRLVDRPGNRIKGKRVGTKFKSKNSNTYYRRITINNISYLEHRLMWFYCYGEWPTGVLDHIDLDGTNNRITNLRLATGTLNNINRKPPKTNKSGYKGIRRTKYGTWEVVIKSKYYIHRSTHTTLEQAIKTHKEKSEELFGEFMRNDYGVA